MPRVGLYASILVCTMICGGTSSALARESGIQGTPDGKRILVNKDVGSSRYAIAQDQDDRSATGNVFFTDDRAPAFLLCSAAGGSTFGCSVADPCPSSGRESGIQRRPDGKGTLVSKDVGGDRYAITANVDDGSLTGNVFFTDGRPPVFLFCQTLGGNAYSCSGADRCGDTTCAPYTFLANITLPADFFTVPDGCPAFQAVGDVTLPADFFRVPSATRGALAVGARQLTGNNPFGGLTKVPTAAAAGAKTAVQPASTFVDQTDDCPGGGSERFQCEVRSDSNGTNTFALVDDSQCTFFDNDGGAVIQNGTVFLAVPDFNDCDPLPFRTGRELVEERDPLVFDFLDAGGDLLKRQTETTSRFVTYGARCTNLAQSTFTSEQARNINGELDVLFFLASGQAHVRKTFTQVAQTIVYSKAPACVPTYTRFAGSVTRSDDLTGEVFTTVYGGAELQYTLEDSELHVAGGLTSQCSGTESAFTYRTVQAPLFDPADPEACPRDGRIEVSSNGTVIGQVVYTVSGGVQLIEADGRVTGFATCNAEGLRLRCE